MRQGEIWYSDLDPTIGNEQAGQRLVLIISGEMLNSYTGLVIICPLTSVIKNFECCIVIDKTIENNLKSTSELLIHQVRSISKARLKKYIGKVDMVLMNEIQQNLLEFLRY